MKLIINLFYRILKNSLPNRIEYYLNQPLRKEHKGSEQQKEWIIEQLTKEIQNGVLIIYKKFTPKYERRED